MQHSLVTDDGVYYGCISFLMCVFLNSTAVLHAARNFNSAVVFVRVDIWAETLISLLSY